MKKFVSYIIIGMLFFSNVAIAGDDDPYIEIITPQLRERNSMIGSLLSLDKEVEVYMGIYIESDYRKNDALIAVHSDLADSYKFYKRSDVGKAMKEEVEMHFVPLEQYKETNLKYLGIHIRLYGVDYMPEVGENFPMTLVFREAGKVDVKARVLNSRTGL